MRRVKLAEALAVEQRLDEALREMEVAERLAPQEPSVRAYRLTYELMARGVTRPRERLIRRLNPPPPTPAGWVQLARDLHAVGDEDLSRYTFDWLREMWRKARSEGRAD